MKIVDDGLIQMDDLEKIAIAYVEEEGDLLEVLEYHDFEDYIQEVGGEYFVCGAKVITVEQYGGGEGGGEYCHAIVAFVNTDESVDYMKVNYNYYSHHGYDFDSAYATEVVPRQVIVTKYFNK